MLASLLRQTQTSCPNSNSTCHYSLLKFRVYGLSNMTTTQRVAMLCSMSEGASPKRNSRACTDLPEAVVEKPTLKLTPGGRM